MASITKMTNHSGEDVYIVQASGGRGRKVRRTWRPEPGWSARTIKRELNKFAAQLENDLASGAVSTKKEADEQARLAALEAAKLKTLRQYADGVYMPAKTATFSENARSSYRQFLDRHILPALGGFLIMEITPAMLSKLLLDFQKHGYAHSTAVKLYNILNGIFQMAFLDDSIKSNPMLKVKRPAPRKDEKPVEEGDKAYTARQLYDIFQFLEREPLKWQAYIHLMADTGIRRGCNQPVHIHTATQPGGYAPRHAYPLLCKIRQAVRHPGLPPSQTAPHRRKRGPHKRGGHCLSQ